jgi:hypothetical protein
MRRLLFFLLVFALALPALALAARSAPGDGSLVVTNANGTILVKGKGLIYGHLEQGKLTVVDYKPDGITVPSVSGAKWKLAPGTLDVVYVGSNVRFLFPVGKYSLRIEGEGIDISAVGRGSVQVIGAGTADDGTYSVDGGKPVAIGFGDAATFTGNDQGRGNSGNAPGKDNGRGEGNPGKP